MCSAPSIFKCSVADAGVVTVINTVPGPAPVRALALTLLDHSACPPKGFHMYK